VEWIGERGAVDDIRGAATMFMQIRRGLEPCTDESNFTKTSRVKEQGRICSWDLYSSGTG